MLAEIDGTVFMHGGINAEFSTESLDDINRRVRRELAAWDEGVRWLEQQKLVLPVSTIVEIVGAARAQLTQFSAYQKEGTLTEDHIRAAKLLLPARRDRRLQPPPSGRTALVPRLQHVDR